jgi:16S rRNA (guanine527-N7)-methyltransferase
LNDLHTSLKKILQQGAEQLAVQLSSRQIDQLLDYLQELNKWNQAYNLSAIRSIEEMVSRHLLDSLAVVPHLISDKNKNVIDVGTGGGLPGIPLAIMFPEWKFTLLDSNGKKTRFLFHVKNLLELDNVKVENHRVEQYRPPEKYQIVISRAFASLQDMTDGCSHLLADDGVFMAMKGIYPENELLPLVGKVNLQSSCQLQVPNTDGERHLLILKPVTC